MAKLSEIFGAEGNPFGLNEDDYVPITDMIGKDIKIDETHSYIKDDKNKLYIRFSYADEIEIEHYTVTGSSAIVKLLSRPDVRKILESDTIDTKIISAKSTVTGRPMYKLEF